MPGVTDMALKQAYAPNKYKLSGKEFQNKEFSDGSGLDMYDMHFRLQDPQIGRFWQLDPLATIYSSISDYCYAEDKVTAGIDLEGLELLPFNSAWFRETGSYTNQQINGKDTKVWVAQVSLVASNIPQIFKDQSGNPLFTPASVKTGPEGDIPDDGQPHFTSANDVLKKTPWTFSADDQDPDPTPSTAGGKLTPDAEASKQFADKANAAGSAFKEVGKWIEMFTTDWKKWRARGDLFNNQSEFDRSIALVNSSAGASSFSVGFKDDLTNFVQDGTLPTINVSDAENSAKYGLSVLQTGISILKNNNIQVQSQTLEALGKYQDLIKAINSLKKHKK
jgi:RHS repeat-associated protein